MAQNTSNAGTGPTISSLQNQLYLAQLENARLARENGQLGEALTGARKDLAAVSAQMGPMQPIIEAFAEARIPAGLIAQDLVEDSADVIKKFELRVAEVLTQIFAAPYERFEGQTQDRSKTPLDTPQITNSLIKPWGLAFVGGPTGTLFGKFRDASFGLNIGVKPGAGNRTRILDAVTKSMTAALLERLDVRALFKEGLESLRADIPQRRTAEMLVDLEDGRQHPELLHKLGEILLKKVETVLREIKPEDILAPETQKAMTVWRLGRASQVAAATSAMGPIKVAMYERCLAIRQAMSEFNPDAPIALTHQPIAGAGEAEPAPAAG